MGKHEVGRAEEQMSARKGTGSRWDVPCDRWKVEVSFGSLIGWARRQYRQWCLQCVWGLSAKTPHEALIWRLGLRGRLIFLVTAWTFNASGLY